jgi:chemotaxis protein MotB
MSTEKEQPIYVIKKIVHHGGHHGGAWKVAYADFVTAMMALFMVLWLLNASDQVKKAIGGYFQDPAGNGKLVGSTMAGAGGDSLDLAKEEMEKLKEKMDQLMKESPAFQKMQENVKFIVTGEGLRIELLETDVGMFFESGSPVPTQKAIEILGLLAQEIGRLPNRVFIEGHTDSQKFSGDYSNWELSADRANTTRRIMQGYGVREDQVMQVRGFADQDLRVKEDPQDPSNRRISILIRYLDPPKLTPEQIKAAEEKAAAEEKGKKAEGGHGEAAKPAGEEHKSGH